jgi:hypothetical protein
VDGGYTASFFLGGIQQLKILLNLHLYADLVDAFATMLKELHSGQDLCM